MKILAFLLVSMMLLAACGGGDDGEVTDINDADSCEDVADVVANELQTLLDEVSDMSLEEAASGDSEVLANFESEMESAEERANELDCSEEEMSDLVEERVDDLEAEGPFAELILESIQGGGDIFDTTP